MKEWPGFALAWLLVKFIGALPRPLARRIAAATVRVLLAMLPRLRKIAMFNLRVAFPDWTDARRNETLHQMTRYLAWQAVEFARFPKYNRANIERVIEIEGHENFLEAQRKGKGVLILTGHIGAWELSSFAHAVYGFSMHYLARPLDNARLDALQSRKAGDPNPAVRLGVVNAKGGRTSWITLPIQRSEEDPSGKRPREARDFYIPRFGWLKNGIVWAQVLNRLQNELDLYFIDASSGRSQLMLSEKSENWVPVNDDFNVLASGDKFVWTSWRDGHTHIYLYDFDGKQPLSRPAQLERQITRGDFEVIGIDDVKQDTVYFTANAEDLRQKSLYSIKLDGTGMKHISREPGTHKISFSGKTDWYVDTFSGVMTPPRLSLCKPDKGCGIVWNSRSIDDYGLIHPKAVTFKADDGTTLLGTLLVPPQASAEKKAPLVNSPYGGPGDGAKPTELLAG